MPSCLEKVTFFGSVRFQLYLGTTAIFLYLYQEITKPTDMSIQAELTEQLNQHGVDFVQFVDVSALPEEQNIAHCTTCLRCLVMCPWTQRYAQTALL